MREALEALSEAVRGNDTTRAAEVLRRHPEIKDELDGPLPGMAFGGTALLCAVYEGNREMVNLLLDAGADINVKSHWWAGGFGVLDHAGGMESHLIERGAVVDIHAAARMGKIDRLRELIAADPEAVRARGGDGKTALHVAASVEIARFVLDHGADIDARDVDHESTAAQYLVRERPEVARSLVERGCSTDILLAAALGDAALVERHLEENPDCIRMRVSDRWFPKKDPRAGGTIYFWTIGGGKTAAIVARELGHEDVVRLLLERSPDGLKLATACELGDEPLVRSLLESRPDIAKTLGEDERSALASAAQRNDTTTVKLMLSAGWPTDARGDHGGTPLHWAAWNGNAEMVREMLRHAPEVDVRGDKHDATPLLWALHGSKHGWRCKTGDYAGTVEALLGAGAEAPSLEGLDASDGVLAVLRRHREQATSE